MCAFLPARLAACVFADPPAPVSPPLPACLLLCSPSVVGKASLELSDVEPALKVLKEKLMSKNVVSAMSVFKHVEEESAA